MHDGSNSVAVNKSRNDRPAPKTRVLVISEDESLGRWFRYAFAGRNSGVRTTVVPDLSAALKALRQLRPGVVIFVERGPTRSDERLRLLQAVLLLDQQRDGSTLAVLYSVADGRATLYHDLSLSQHIEPKDVAEVVRNSLCCPLFRGVGDARSAFPEDCHFMPVLLRGAAGGLGAAQGSAVEPVENGIDERRHNHSEPSVRRGMAEGACDREASGDR